MAKIKITYGRPESLKEGDLIFSYGPATKRLHEVMRKARKVAVPQEREKNVQPEGSPKNPSKD